jgi:hypothetical protein
VCQANYKSITLFLLILLPTPKAKEPIIYGKTELNPAEKQKLFSLENIEVYFFENLHAKCYFNKDNMVITSMNIYEFSEKNNREMGMLLNVERDTEAFMKAFNEAVSIVKNAIRQREVKAEIKEGIGYCIRCFNEIKNNHLKPLCPACYKQWSKYGNKLYTEKYCHHCGSETKSNISSPLCQSCTTTQ